MAGSIPNSTQRLLNGAVDKFNDIQNPCFAIPATYYVSLNGFGYILTDKANKVPVNLMALHISNSQEQTVDGIYDDARANIQINKSLSEILKPKDSCVLIQYQDFYIMVNSLKSFNPHTDTYHYSGQILNTRNKKFIIVDEEEAKENLCINSMSIWLNNKSWFPCPIFPAYISPFNMDVPYLTIDITETEALTMVTKLEDTIYQYKMDRGKLVLINGTDELAQEIIYLTNTLYTDFDANSFGVMNFLKWYQGVSDRQNAFGIMANKKICHFQINYNLIVKSDITLENFRGMLAQINKHEIELYKPT